MLGLEMFETIQMKNYLQCARYFVVPLWALTEQKRSCAKAFTSWVQPFLILDMVRWVQWKCKWGGLEWVRAEKVRAEICKMGSINHYLFTLPYPCTAIWRNLKLSITYLVGSCVFLSSNLVLFLMRNTTVIQHFYVNGQLSLHLWYG